MALRRTVLATGGDATGGAVTDAEASAAEGLAVEGLAAEVVGLLRARKLTVGCAESLTGGLLCGRLTSVPGASAAVRGAVVAYATDVKAALLGVPPAVLAERGAVDPDVARAMASGVRAVLGADVGVATTGVAGPDAQDGQPVGTVYVAAVWAAGDSVRALSLSGDRATIRRGSVDAALALLQEVLRDGGGVTDELDHPAGAAPEAGRWHRDDGTPSTG